MTLQRPSCDAGTPRSLHDRHDLHCYTADVQVRRRRLLHAEAARRRAAWGWCVAREAHEKLQADGDEMLTNAAKLLLRFCSVCCAGSAKPFGKACLSVWYALFTSPAPHQPLRAQIVGALPAVYSWRAVGGSGPGPKLAIGMEMFGP